MKLTNFKASPFSSFRFYPSYFPRVPIAVPYWNRATYRAIFDCVAEAKIIEGDELGKLKAALTESLCVAHAILSGSGSLGLEIALRSFGVGRGDEVVIPSFCCSAVIAPIVALGAVPVLAEVDAELNVSARTVEAALNTKTKAIIVAHLFGNPAEIHPISALARSRNIHVIDDAAQALGATVDGRPVGSFGDAGVVSFGRGKVCFGLGGAAVVFQNNELAARAAKLTMPEPPSMKAFGNFISILVWHRWRRWSHPLQRALSSFSRYGPDRPPSPYRRETMANLNAAVAFSLMQTLAENIKARRARVSAYRELLSGDERVELITHRNGSACLAQVIRILPRRANHDMAARLIVTLGNAGYEVQGSYVPIHLLPGFEQCQRARLPHTENVWEDLIELPCEPQVKLAHVEHIAAIIKKAIQS